MTQLPAKLWMAAMAGYAALAMLSAGCGSSVRPGDDAGEIPVISAVDTPRAGARKEPVAQEAVTPTEPPEAQNVAPRSKSIREISFDTIKFDIEKGQPFERSMLTPQVEKLDGQRVRIRGYMLPSFQQSGIKQFVLVRDNMQCCFGPSAALYDCIIVEMINDQSCDFSVRPIAVEGKFAVREFKGPDDTHLAIYHLDGERVR
jgi:hypothetical protein